MKKNCSTDEETILKILENILRSQEQIIQTLKGLNNFWKENYFACIGTIKIPIGTNNWDVENYKNKLENITHI